MNEFASNIFSFSSSIQLIVVKRRRGDIATRARAFKNILNIDVVRTVMLFAVNCAEFKY